MTKELGIPTLSIANRNVPLSDWIKYAVVQTNWGKSSTGVFEAKERFHAFRTRTPHDVRPTVVTTASHYRSQLLGFQTAGRNINEATTLLNIFSNSLASIEPTLFSMQTLASTASDSSMTDSERALNDLSYQELASELDVTSKDSSYQDIDLLSGHPAALRFQVSIRGEGTHQITLPLPNMTLNGLFGGSTSISTEGDATTALSNINAGLDQVKTSQREADVVLKGLTGSGTMSGRVIAFMTEKLEAISDKPIDRTSIEYIVAELLEKAEVSILAQDPTRLDEPKGVLNALDLMDEELPIKMDLYSLDPELKFTPRLVKPFVNIEGESGIKARSKAPFWNLPTNSD